MHSINTISQKVIIKYIIKKGKYQTRLTTKVGQSPNTTTETALHRLSADKQLLKPEEDGSTCSDPQTYLAAYEDYQLTTVSQVFSIVQNSKLSYTLTYSVFYCLNKFAMNL